MKTVYEKSSNVSIHWFEVSCGFTPLKEINLYQSEGIDSITE